MTKTVIHTLNARGNVMLDVMRDHFKLGPDRMHFEIQQMHADVVSALLKKGIRYGDLKSALVPNPQRKEIALIFDTDRIKDSWYGFPIHEKIIPLFSRDSNHSVREGDYIGENDQQERLFLAFQKDVKIIREVTWKHSSQFYIVYINNLSQRMFDTFWSGLKTYEPFVGFADMTNASVFKIYLSTMLVACYVKHRKIILMGHEDDADLAADINMAGYPFEDFGYTCRSVPGHLYDVLLSYKIETPVFEGFESDSEFSINSVNPNPLPLTDFDIEVSADKFDYLMRQKTGSLKRIGLAETDQCVLADLIRRKIHSNYIYNMTFDDEHGTTLFDIILEFRPPDSDMSYRVLVALEYIPQEERLRLVTLH